jgi:hypothetical protein
MNFYPIFEDESSCKLWSVCYPEHQVNGENKDIFSILFDDRWSDTSYVRGFLKKNQSSFNTPFWQGMSMSEALDRIQIERTAFDKKLCAIETKSPGYETMSLDSVFKKLHDNIYSISFNNEAHMKAKLNTQFPFLRIYAIVLADGTYIVTGGGIKLTEKMEGELGSEKDNLKRVQQYLKNYGITDRDGLIDHLNSFK